MGKKYIELNNFMTVNHLASTGGQAKILIRTGNVIVNGRTETRCKRKLFEGDTVRFAVTELEVKKEILRKELPDEDE